MANIVTLFSIALLAVALFTSISSTINSSAAVELVKNSVLNFQVEEGIDAGLFRTTIHTGTTETNAFATYAGLTSLKKFSDSSLLSRAVSHEKAKHISLLGKSIREEQNSKTKAIAISLLSLSLPHIKNSSLSLSFSSSEFFSRLYEKKSGFRLNFDETASLSGTFYSLLTIFEHGTKKEISENQEAFNDVSSFLLSLRGKNGGFSSKKEKEASVESTFLAHVSLSLLNVKTHLDENLVKYLSSQQQRNGGFKSQIGYANSADTLMAMYILNDLKKNNIDISSIDISRANTFIYSCISPKGIFLHPNDFSPNIFSALYFSYNIEAKNELISFSPYEYVISLAKYVILAAIPLLMLKSSPFSSMIDWQVLVSNLVICFSFSVSGILLAQLSSPFSVIVFVSYAIISVIQFYENADSDQWGSRDQKDCQLWLVTSALIASALHLSAFLLLLYQQSETFFSFGWYILAGVDAFASLISTYIAGSFLDARKRSHHGFPLFFNAASLSSITSILIQYSFLYIQDSASVADWSALRGVIPSLCVLFPLLSQIASAFGSAFGANLLGVTRKISK